MVSHPKTGLDPPMGSDRESGRDKILFYVMLHKFNNFETNYLYL